MAKKVLLLGDSHSVGRYGKELEKNFKNGGYEVTRVAYGGMTADRMKKNIKPPSPSAVYGDYFSIKNNTYDILVISFATNDASGMDAYDGEPKDSVLGKTETELAKFITNPAYSTAPLKTVAANIDSLKNDVKATSKYWVGSPPFHPNAAKTFNDSNPPRWRSIRFKSKMPNSNGIIADLNVRSKRLWDYYNSSYPGKAINPVKAPGLSDVTNPNDIHFKEDGPGGKIWADYVYNFVNTVEKGGSGGDQNAGLPTSPSDGTAGSGGTPPSVPSIPPEPPPSIKDFENKDSFDLEKIGGYLDIKTATFNGIKAKFAEKFYSRNSIDGIEMYRGQILRKVEEDAKPSDSWFSSLIGIFYSTTSVKCKVRIPELHMFLPIPKTFDENENDKKIIDQYPDFIYDPTSPYFEGLAVGDIVNVTFSNLSNFTGGRLDSKIGQKPQQNYSDGGGGATGQASQGYAGPVKGPVGNPDPAPPINIVPMFPNEDDPNFGDAYFRNHKDKEARYAEVIKFASKIWQIPYNLLRGFCHIESTFSADEGIRSPAGATGLAQVLPSTFTFYLSSKAYKDLQEKFKIAFGIDPSQASITNPGHNVFVGAYIVRDHLKKYNGDITKACAAYNGGPGMVNKALRRASETGGDWRKYINQKETYPYTWKVPAMWKRYNAQGTS